MPVSYPPPSRFIVEPSKVALYLLNVDHLYGRSKASFFIGRGFDPARPNDLKAALLDHPRTAILTHVASTSWGPRYIYEGTLIAPHGITPVVRTVWEGRTGEDAARLITAYRI